MLQRAVGSAGEHINTFGSPGNCGWVTRQATALVGETFRPIAIEISLIQIVATAAQEDIDAGRDSSGSPVFTGLNAVADSWNGRNDFISRTSTAGHHAMTVQTPYR